MPASRRNLVIFGSPFQLDNRGKLWLLIHFVLVKVSVWHLSMVYLSRILFNKAFHVANNVKIRHCVHWCLAGVGGLLSHGLIDLQEERRIRVGLQTSQKIIVLSWSFRLSIMLLDESLGQKQVLFQFFSYRGFIYRKPYNT